MVALQTPQMQLGWRAQDFTLQGVDGRKYSLNDVKGDKGLLVIFMCNHCPYVKAIIDKLVADAKELKSHGIGVIAISANDATAYPEDSYENMKKFATQHNFQFPYVYDGTQEVAKVYGAVCTPDFFGFNNKLELQYRGRFDSSQRNENVDSKHELLMAMNEIAEKGSFAGEQIPSIDCSIKWK